MVRQKITPIVHGRGVPGRDRTGSILIVPRSWFKTTSRENPGPRSGRLTLGSETYAEPLELVAQPGGFLVILELDGQGQLLF